MESCKLWMYRKLKTVPIKSIQMIWREKRVCWWTCRQHRKRALPLAVLLFEGTPILAPPAEYICDLGNEAGEHGLSTRERLYTTRTNDREDGGRRPFTSCRAPSGKSHHTCCAYRGYPWFLEWSWQTLPVNNRMLTDIKAYEPSKSV